MKKELARQDRESNGLCALTRALMKIPINRNPNKGPLLREEQKNSSFGTTVQRRNGELVVFSSSTSSIFVPSFHADYSEKSLAIIDKAKENAHLQQEKLERVLIAQERRAKADLMRMQKKFLMDSIQSQQPMIDLAAKQERRLKIYGDPARETEEERCRERMK